MNHNEPFTPESVDEQIDQFSTVGRSSESGARVVQGLHALYADQQHLIERVWERLAGQANTFDNDAHTSNAFFDTPIERIDPMSAIDQVSRISEQPTAYLPKIAQPPELRRARQRKAAPLLTVIAASLVALFVVSSLLWVFYGTHSRQAGQSQLTATPAIVQDTPGIYVFGAGGLSKFDSRTHKLIWNVPASAMPDNVYQVWQTPLVTGNTVIVYYGSDILAFNAQTGAASWLHRFSNMNVIPFLDNNQLYVRAFNLMGISTTIAEIEPTSGAFKDTYQPAQQEVLEANVHNNILYYLGSDGTGSNQNTFLYAVRLPANVLLWHQLVSNKIFMIVRNLFVADDMVSAQIANVSSGQQYFATFDALNGKSLGQTPMFSMDNSAGSVTSTDFLAIGTTLLSVITSPLQDEYMIHAYSFETRSFIWQKTFQVSQGGQARFATSADTLYLETENPTAHQIADQLTAFDIKTGNILWQKPLVFNQPASDMSYAETLEARTNSLYLIRVIAGPVQVGAKSSTQEYISAFGAASGSPLWIWQSPSEAPQGVAAYVV